MPRRSGESTPAHPQDPVRQLRLVVEVEDLDTALAFYRDALGLEVEEAIDGENGERVVILDAGRATLELANPAQKRMIDEVEVGRQVSPRLRVAFEVVDAAATTSRLEEAGATVVAPPVVTPWQSLNARLDAPGPLHITVFQEGVSGRESRRSLARLASDERAVLPDWLHALCMHCAQVGSTQRRLMADCRPRRVDRLAILRGAYDKVAFVGIFDAHPSLGRNASAQAADLIRQAILDGRVIPGGSVRKRRSWPSNSGSAARRCERHSSTHGGRVGRGAHGDEGGGSVTPPAGDLKQNAAEQGGRIGPLAGIRVIELGTLLAGPFAGRLLGDLGAEVIKIEAPGQPDPIREWGKARYQGRSLMWPVQSRNKKCVTLNLRLERGQELLLRLVEKADVVTENFRPGTLEKWNLGYEQLSEVNPGIVLARISGYGQTGPYASRAGFASVSEAMGGIRHINGFPGEAPPRMHISLGDSLAAMFATQGILSALYWRDACGGGLGQVVDVSLMESAFALLESTVPEYDRLGIVRGPQGTNLKGIAPSNIFRSSDDKWMVIAANADGVFRRLCDAIGRPELADDERFSTHLARGDTQDEIEGIIADWARERTASEIDRILNEAGVICGPIYTIEDIFDDPQYQARDMLLEQVDPEFGSFVGPGIVPKLTRTPGAVRWSATWEEGSHNREVYGDLLGLTDDELAELREEGVL